MEARVSRWGSLQLSGGLQTDPQALGRVSHSRVSGCPGHLSGPSWVTLNTFMGSLHRDRFRFEDKWLHRLNRSPTFPAVTLSPKLCPGPCHPEEEGR